MVRYGGTSPEEWDAPSFCILFSESFSLFLEFSCRRRRTSSLPLPTVCLQPRSKRRLFSPAATASLQSHHRRLSPFRQTRTHTHTVLDKGLCRSDGTRLTGKGMLSWKVTGIARQSAERPGFHRTQKTKDRERKYKSLTVVPSSSACLVALSSSSSSSFLRDCA